MLQLSHLQIAITAAIEAGNVVMEVYETDFKVSSKLDDSPITRADEQANTVIMSYLEKTDIPIISEENKEIPYEVRKKWTHCWMVDPLDGTKEFVKRNGEFTVNIAFIENGAPILGVIYIPVEKMLYFTSEDGQSGYKIHLSSQARSSAHQIIENAVEIFPSAEGEVLNVVGSRSHFNTESKEFLVMLEKEKKVRLIQKGSSLKFCTIAEGKAQIYPRFSPTMEWDTAAGHALCRAVGAEVINQETKEPLIYNKESLLNPSFVARYNDKSRQRKRS